MSVAGAPSLLQATLPTWILLLGALLTALLGWRVERFPLGGHRVIGTVAEAAAMAAAVGAFHGVTPATQVALSAGSGAVVADRFSLFAVILVCSVGIVAVLGSGTATERLGARMPGYHALLLTATAGGTVVALQWEMGALVAGLALLLPSLVGMVALEKTTEGAGEAALAQVAVGGLCLGVLLFGLSIVYGATGTTDLAVARTALAHASPPLEGLGLALTLLGLAFLVGAAPLHRGVLAVARSSQGAVAASVLGISVTAGGIVLVRVLVSGFTASLRPWVVLAGVLALVASLYPALVSLPATSVRRVIGLGASLQGGFLLMALLGSGTGRDGRPEGGVEALLFGLPVFVLSLMASLQALGILEGDGVGARVADLRGLARRSPLAAGLLTLGLAGLAGLPPMAGFLGRILIVQSAVGGGYPWVAAGVLAASLIYAIPILRILAAIFVEDDEEPALVSGAPLLGVLTAGATALLGVVAMVLAGPLTFAAHLAALSLR